MARVADGKVVIIHYTLSGQDGAVIESTLGREPLAYLHGSNSIIPGLERALANQDVGAKISVDVPAADAYGERKGSGPQPVHRREFPRKAQLREGMPIEVQDSTGKPVAVWVTKVKGSQVWIDVDHPLAGRALHFEVEVLHVRDPFPEELQHGHAHGDDGHHAH